MAVTMTMRAITAILTLSALTGCTSGPISSSLGTLKNPWPVLDKPSEVSQNAFVQRNYAVLLKAAGPESSGKSVPESEMREYLSAGFALSDIYCDIFFRDADESQRRRKYGRGATNDVGTAITAVLGLANAGQSLVTGVATSFGLADNLWRNYDEAFVVGPSLANVRSLVLAAQDNFREVTLGARATNPLTNDYGTAQSVILRYANLCSTLGMQDLLNRSADRQREQLNEKTQGERSGEKPSSKPAQAAADLPLTANTEATAQTDPMP
ncbi:MAG TPA: hypothetical protein VEZ70_10910 [Allosphingosinicella sp.]|nr:hypothetical protein [Allosphingosinicella sp.]